MPRFSLHNLTPNHENPKSTSELRNDLRDDQVTRWLLKEAGAELIEKCSCIPPRKSDIRKRSQGDQLALYVLGLVSIGIENTIPDLIALTVNLREKETIGIALNGLRSAMRNEGLDGDFHWTGVQVPEDGEYQRHAHLFVLGIHPGTREWGVLLKWKRGRNRRMPRSVLQKWARGFYGWYRYMLLPKNLGVDGATIGHSRGLLKNTANNLNFSGAAGMVERFDQFCSS